MGLFSSTANVIAQAADPGPIGPGGIWSDTDAETTFRRNDANTDWVQILPVIDESVGTHASTKITGLATQTQALAMNSNAITNVSLLSYGNILELTIATGTVVRTISNHLIDTQSNDPTDDLDTVTGFSPGDVLFLKSANSNRDPTIKDTAGGTGEMLTAGDFTLDNDADIMQLKALGGSWLEISRSSNA